MFKAMLTTVIALAAFNLAGCGTMPDERGVTGAGIGAGIGLIGGPPGVLVGAAIGGVVGATTTKEEIDIGDPPRIGHRHHRRYHHDRDYDERYDDERGDLDHEGPPPDVDADDDDDVDANRAPHHPPR